MNYTMLSCLIPTVFEICSESSRWIMRQADPNCSSLGSIHKLKKGGKTG